MEMQEIQALQTIHDVLTQLLKPLPNAVSQSRYEIVCSDSNILLYFSKLFSWLADYIENATRCWIASNPCPICIILTEKLAEQSEIGYPTQSYQDYIVAYKEYEAMDLHTSGAKNIQKALWSIWSLNPE